jgi:apolipoprotein N-acyltransferase
MIFNKKYLPTLFALIFGATTVLGFAPYYIFPIPIFAIAGLCYLWAKAGTPKAAWTLGFSYGLGLYGVGIYWIYISLHDFGGMPWWFAGFSTFCLCAFMALFAGLVGYFSKKISGKNQSLLWVSVPVLWGLSDWVRSWIFTGFPWLTMGYSQVPHSPLAGYMPIVGVYGVSVITVFISALIGYWIANKHQTPLFKRNMIGFVTLTLVAGYILKTFEWTTPSGVPIKVALVQGNIAQNTKWSPEKAQSTIDQYLSMLQATKADLIILPETALPVISSQLDESVKNTILAHAEQHSLIIGMVEYDEKTNEYFNSALGFGDADVDGHAIQSYAKNHLVPFGEFIPLKRVFGWIYRDWLNMPLSDLSRGGAQQQPMRLAGQKIGVNICYEDVFGEEIIRQLPTATLLVNISNDAWYGQSYAANQHMQFSQARALETGRYMLRSTNTGATASINQHGYVLAHAPHDVQTTLDITAQGYSGSTPYVRWGNWPFIVFCFTVLIALVWRKRGFLR